MKLNLENANVHEVTMSVQQARDLLDTLESADLSLALDNAQGQVFSQDYKAAYVVIEIL